MVTIILMGNNIYKRLCKPQSDLKGSENCQSLFYLITFLLANLVKNVHPPYSSLCTKNEIKKTIKLNFQVRAKSIFKNSGISFLPYDPPDTSRNYFPPFLLFNIYPSIVPANEKRCNVIGHYPGYTSQIEIQVPKLSSGRTVNTEMGN